MNQCFFGDCRDIMKQLIADDVKVQTCVTSPPYWGLRDYGAEGQIGLERTPQEYIETMVEVFSLVRDILSEDGTLWINLGDSYTSGGRKERDPGQSKIHPAYEGDNFADGLRPETPPGLKPKDLVGIPWRVAFALQSDGRYLRSDIIWHKPNPMPESVTDRPTKSHEYIFLLSKSERYYYDHKAIAEPCLNPEDDIRHIERATLIGKRTPTDECNGIRKSWRGSTFDTGKTGEMMETRGGLKRSGNKQRKPSAARGCPEGTGKNQSGSVPWEGLTKNKRSVWTVNTTPFSGAHFATFPPKLIEPCVLAGSRPGDIVLDPFFGSGTTGEVAAKLGRQWIGCELQKNYEPLQRQRTAQTGMPI